jgi:galactose mutarotase-like enzyme
MDHLLSAGRSVVTINSLGGKFNWRLGDRKILHLEESNGRQTHVCCPIFGPPTGVLPGATQEMKQHGFVRTSELQVSRPTDKRVHMELVSTAGNRIDDIYQQYPFDFVIGLDWKLVGENRLHFSLGQTNLSARPAPSALVLHAYLQYCEAGVTFPGLAGQAYESRSGEQGTMTDPTIKGKLIPRDWSFQLPQKNTSNFLVRYFDGQTIMIRPSGSHPHVDGIQFFTDPKLGTFVCAEPKISTVAIAPGRTAWLKVEFLVSQA